MKREPPRRQPPKRPAAERDDRADTERVVGIAAAYAVLERRPRDVLNLVHGRDARKDVAALLKHAAQSRIAYREVSAEELSRMAGTLHHEGVCLLVRKRRPVTERDVIQAFARPGFALALDDVQNPHNVGAMLRTAAYLGAHALVVSGIDALTPAAVRVAEGGAEHVPVCFTRELDRTLDELEHAGITIVGADAHEGVSHARFRYPARTLIVLGNERMGLSREVAARCSEYVRIDGTNHVESLNVSVAAGILMSGAASAMARNA